MKKVLLFFIMMLTLGCVTSTPVKADDGNPKLPIKEPYMVYDDEGNASIYIGENIPQAFSTGLTHWEGSKKGIQINEYFLDPNASDLGIKHVLLNMVLSDGCITYANGEYHLADESYVKNYKTMVPYLNSQGISVSLVLLMDWSDNPDIQRLIYAGARTPNKWFYELNTQDELGRNAWTNIFGELVQTFSADGCRIDHYILGNEVNQTGSGGYNYTGSSNLATNAGAHADAFAILDRALRTYCPSARAYVSLDHNWTATDTGFSGKVFLDAFVAALEARDPEAGWNVAWHGYCPALASNQNTSMDRLVMWNSSLVTKNENTAYICGSNIEVLTNYIANRWGRDHLVHLAEQGYDARGSEDWQAAFIAYTYYAAQYNDMVVAVTYRAYVDNAAEQGLRFGLVSGYMSDLEAASNKAAYIESHKRKAYDVFKYMDTDQAMEYTNQCLATIGAVSWNELIPTGQGPAPDGWNVGPDGKTRYYVQDGQLLTGLLTVDGNTYYLGQNGVPTIGTPVIDGKKYWFSAPDGIKQTGRLNLRNMILYFDPENGGAAVTGYYKFADGREYVFNRDGVVVTHYGTPIIDGKKYWVTGDGSIRTGWQRLLNWKLYFDPEVKYAHMDGVFFVDGKPYAFNKDGVSLNEPGTPIFSGKKYWCFSDGSLGTGWFTLKTWKMYFDPTTYEAAVGLKEIEGKKYLFNRDGVCYMQSRTEVIDGNKYWFNPDGSLGTGWQHLDKMTLYFWPDTCIAATGTQTIDGQTYTFDENGVLLE